jgi:co-chaperonin GroES (HSP10)
MPPLEWATFATALPGRLLVKRLEMPLLRGRILLPESTRRGTRSAEATIVSLGAGVENMPEDFQVGDQVLLSGLVGRTIKFGLREEVELLDLPATAVVAKLPSALRDDAVSATADPRRHWDHTLDEPLLREGHEEGDRRATR